MPDKKRFCLVCKGLFSDNHGGHSTHRGWLCSPDCLEKFDPDDAAFWRRLIARRAAPHAL